MASAYVQKRAPMVLATTLLAQAAAATERLTDAKRLQFKLRLTKMLEQLAEVAILREANMRDRTEAATLDAAVAALGDGDTQRALHVLSERRAHLARKEAARRQQPSTDPLDDSDDEEQAEEEEEQEVYRESHEGGSPHAAALAEPVASDSLEDGEHWRTLAPGLHVCEEPFACEQAAAGCCSSPRQEENDFERRLPEFRAALLQDGYMQSEEPVVGAAALHALREGVGALQAAGWPPVCVFMYDEAWAAVAALWDRAEALMGGACVLEPSFTAFRLSHRQGPQGKYVGTNFALPHRDYTYAESTTAAGEPQLLSVWLPLNDVTLDNGCMYVVPREFDPNFQRDHMYEHKQVITHGAVKNLTFLHFALAGIRPLPARAGSINAWHSNVIHWGSNCNRNGADDPRASLAFVFRRADSTPDAECPPLARGDLRELSVQRRLRYVTRALAYFKHWYSIPDAVKALLAPYAPEEARKETPE